MVDIDKIYLEQLDYVINTFRAYRERNLQTQNPGAWVVSEASHFDALAIAAINRVAGPNSIYGQQVDTILEKYGSFAQDRLLGVVQALRDDIVHGFLTSLKEIVRGDLFSDFLDMADYLAKQDYKDAAAVIGGGVLESHLRQLCGKYDIDIEIMIGIDLKPKRSEQFNSDLAKKKVYGLLEQKSVTTWLDLRNKAAHAKYEEYSKDQVTLMLQWLRVFIARYPA
jgi:hypothetical protein